MGFDMGPVSKRATHRSALSRGSEGRHEQSNSTGFGDAIFSLPGLRADQAERVTVTLGVESDDGQNTTIEPTGCGPVGNECVTE
jgi:hypothetical protein